MKRFHLARLIVIAVLSGALLFWMGWIMGQKHYKAQVVEALKASENDKAIDIWVERQKEGVDVTNDPFFVLTKYIVWLKKGKAENAQHNLNRLIDMLGR